MNSFNTWLSSNINCLIVISSLLSSLCLLILLLMILILVPKVIKALAAVESLASTTMAEIRPALSETRDLVEEVREFEHLAQNKIISAVERVEHATYALTHPISHSRQVGNIIKTILLTVIETFSKVRS